MEILLNILLVIVLVAFIIYQILEIVGSIRFYKRMEREHEEFINKLKEEYNGTELEETQD